MTHQYKRSLFIRIPVLLFVLTVSSTSNADSPDDIVVFVNNTSSVSSLSDAEVKQIFLKKKNNWPGGEKIVSVNAQEGTPLREEFRKKVLSMSASEEATYWENQRIRYQLVAPSEMANGPKAVFKMKAAVSYAYRKDVPSGVVKIVFAVPK